MQKYAVYELTLLIILGFGIPMGATSLLHHGWAWVWMRLYQSELSQVRCIMHGTSHPFATARNFRFAERDRL